MGGRNPDRVPRLGNVRHTPPGWLRLVTCLTCGHRALLPIEALLKKHGELATVEGALMALRCSACRGLGATVAMVRLCEAGCPRQRG